MANDSETVEHILDGGKKLKGRFKDALTRTRSKFHRRESENEQPERDEFKLSQDVNDFLAAGKPRPSADDRLPFPTVLSDASTSDLDLSQAQAPSRGVPIPRLDVSHSSRFPGARPVEIDPRSQSNEYLRPRDTSKERSQSLSSFKKRRPRLRNLSVSFENKPPVIIGWGGDEAEQPTIEISRLRERARSLSPMPPCHQRSASNGSASSNESIRRKPVPSPQLQQYQPPPGQAYLSPPLPQRPPPPAEQYAQPRNPFDDNATDDEDFVPKPLVRAPTGASDLMRSADQEFEMSLQTPESAGDHDTSSHFRTAVISPKPIKPVRPPEVPPLVEEAIANETSNHLSSQTQRALVAHDGDGMVQPVKPGAVRVTISNQDLPQEPTLPNIAPPTSTTMTAAKVPPPIPPRRVRDVDAMTHRPKEATVDETQTMQQGAGGWL